MAYHTEDEIFYMIHQGDNEGVVFTILDFIITFEKETNSFKFDYKPIILANELNAGVEGIYAEIKEIVKAKVEMFVDKV